MASPSERWIATWAAPAIARFDQPAQTISAAALAFAYALGQAGESNRLGLKKTSTAAVLSVLSHGLDHPSRYQPMAGARFEKLLAK